MCYGDDHGDSDDHGDIPKNIDIEIDKELIPHPSLMSQLNKNSLHTVFLFLSWEPKSRHWYGALSSGMHWVDKANKGQL